MPDLAQAIQRYPLLRRRIPRAAWVIPDFLWALLTAGACGAALILGGEGTARLYALLGLLGGGGLYCLGLRALIKALRSALAKPGGENL